MYGKRGISSIISIYKRTSCIREFRKLMIGEREYNNQINFRGNVLGSLGETSKFITAGCSQNVAAFNSEL